MNIRRGTQLYLWRLEETHVGKAIFGIAKDELHAIAIADDLRGAGFSHDDVSVLFPDTSGTKDFAHEQHTKRQRAP